jgi:hypothetical protein
MILSWQSPPYGGGGGMTYKNYSNPFSPFKEFNGITKIEGKANTSTP